MNNDMKIAFFELEGWEEPAIRAALPSDELYLTGMKLDAATLPPGRDFEAISVFVNSKIDDGVLAQFPDLKLVTTRSTGFEHIDAEACKKRGVIACSVPGYGENTVAEFAFGLVLNLTRNMYQAIDRIKETGSFAFVGMRGTDLKGKTLGIVGTGMIGKEMVRIAKGFGMNVIAHDAYPDDEAAASLGFTYMPFEELLRHSDVISLHCPYNKATHHLINMGNIGLVKKGAYLINTARGGLIETDALVEALEKGLIAGAGLDVLEEEGDVKEEYRFFTDAKRDPEELRTAIGNHILMRMPNVLVTPHTAFNTKEALARILDMTFENIEGFRKGAPAHVIP